MKSFNIIKFLFAVLAIFVFSTGVAAVTDINPFAIMGVVTGLTFLPFAAPEGVLFSGLNQEIWTDVLVDTFRRAEEASFLNEIPDESRHVLAARNDNEIIHLVDVGVDPAVLINNTTYPIPVSTQTDGDIPISLDKYQTEVTAVTDDEMQFIAYDKIALVQSKHTKAVIKERGMKGLHSLGPAANTAATPILPTSGSTDGAGRQMLEYADLIKFKRAIDTAGDDEEGRVLVLCSDHYNDLLLDPNTKNLFTGQFQNESSGRLNENIAGFKIYWYNGSPNYTPSLTKLSYGAVPAADEYKASIYFSPSDMFRAAGKSKNYSKAPEPQTQQWEYNIRHNYIVLPRKVRATGALVSVVV